MSNELTEEYIKKNCPHCNFYSEAYKYLLEQTDNFSIVCDVHPITEGHILIIPKQHFSCVGEYLEDLYQGFITLYQKVSEFLVKQYGSVSSFEHGKFGQTVFHSHIHLIPFQGEPTDIVPEGLQKLTKINNLSQLKSYFKNHGGYLFFSIGNDRWVVDKYLAVPRFFRDRFAKALNRPERGNWKKMHVKETRHSKFELEAQDTKKCWEKHVN